MAATISGVTGGKCPISGVYRCRTHPTMTIPLSKGERFPPCSRNGGHGTTWILLRRA